MNSVTLVNERPVQFMCGKTRLIATLSLVVVGRNPKSEIGHSVGIGLVIQGEQQILGMSKELDVVRYWRTLMLLKEQMEREFASIEELFYFIWTCYRATSPKSGEGYMHEVVAEDVSLPWNRLMAQYPSYEWYHDIVRRCTQLRIPYVGDESFNPHMQRQLALVCGV